MTLRELRDAFVDAMANANANEFYLLESPAYKAAKALVRALEVRDKDRHCTCGNKDCQVPTDPESADAMLAARLGHVSPTPAPSVPPPLDNIEFRDSVIESAADYLNSYGYNQECNLMYSLLRERKALRASHEEMKRRAIGLLDDYQNGKADTIKIPLLRAILEGRETTEK